MTTPSRRDPARPDPALRDLVRAMDRRGFLRTMGIGVGGAAFLAACGIGGTEEGPSESTGSESSGPKPRGKEEKVLEFANWPFYIDTAAKDETKHKTLLDFTKETGIEVNYYEEINSNDQYFGKIRPQLAQGESIDRDIIVLTDWMAARLIASGWVEQLDHSNIPNMKNLLPSLRSPGFDPNRDFTLPWQSGLTGIGFNPNATDVEVTSINDLFNPKLKGKVTFLEEMRDTMGLVMAGMGIDPADHTKAEYQRAIDKVQKAVDDGQIRAFTGNEYTSDLAAGNLVACVAWSGDVIQLQFDDPDLQFVTPDEGALLWSDTMMIPKGAEHPGNAEKLMDFVYQPEIAAQIAAWVNYITPVEGAKEAMKDIDESLVEFELIFPSNKTLEKTFEFRDLSAAEEREYQELFQAVIGA